MKFYLITEKTTIDVVHSPDDGGFYASEWERAKPHRHRHSKIYKTRRDTTKAIDAGTVEWDSWK